MWLNSLTVRGRSFRQCSSGLRSHALAQRHLVERVAPASEAPFFVPHIHFCTHTYTYTYTPLHLLQMSLPKRTKLLLASILLRYSLTFAYYRFSSFYLDKHTFRGLLRRSLCFFMVISYSSSLFGYIPAHYREFLFLSLHMLYSFD